MLNIGINEDLSKTSQWHFLPATFISNTQETVPNAKVSNYFKSSIKQDPDLTGYFHGHLLKGNSSKPSDLFKAICYKSEDNQNELDIVISERVIQAVDWRKDRKWQPFEGHLGTILKHQLIQKALHEE